MAPDELLDAATEAWQLEPGTQERSLSRRVREYQAALNDTAVKSE
jgi:hypothetical protein